MPVLNLTSQFLKGIKPPDSGRVEYWDTGVAGLCLRVTASGTASWSFRYRPRESGKQYERMTFGSVDSPRCPMLATAPHESRRSGGWGQPAAHATPEARGVKNALTFDRLAERYLSDYAKPNKASWKDDEQRLGRARRVLGLKEAAS